MTTSKQLPLELGHRTAIGRADFLVTDANREAVGWIDTWPNWPAPCLGLYGPPGCGKSHLVQVFVAKAGAHVLEVGEISEVEPVTLVEAHSALIWDNADAVPDESALFHLFNVVREARKHLLIVGQTAPARWDVALPDLKSRLSGMPSVEIRSPDDATIAAVLVKLFRDRQLEVTPELVDYVQKRIPRTFAAIQKMTERVDHDALAQNRKITVPLVRDILDSYNFRPD
ncbi:MAG: DnaA/Hda family protein [Rhodospirillaceae bacterium]|nr:DnaA/Hda family protein [Rhodospirillaceae bacterium]